MTWLSTKMTEQYSRGRIGEVRRVAARAADPVCTTTVD